MKNIAQKTFRSVYGSLDSNKIDNTFEVIKFKKIFGLDFMIDD